MTTHLPPLKAMDSNAKAGTGPARLWLCVFATGFAFITALLLITLFTPVPYGDLTRIGQLSEHEFGWRIEPPPLRDDELRGVPLAQADIVVVGDSFSMTHVWQSLLVRSGYRVTTIYWGQLGEALCGDFSQWLSNAGFRGRTVVIESVERFFDERMKNSEACANGTMKTSFSSKDSPFMEPLRTLPGFTFNSSAKITSGAITQTHTWRARKATGDLTIEKQTKVRHVSNGCAMFSHRLCDRALFYSQDDDNGELTLQTLTRAQAFAKAQASLTFLWAIIPNKTTVYLAPERSADFVHALRASKQGPDLFALMQEQRTKVRDLYFPNDTHLSMHGQLVLGERLLQEIREILPGSPHSTP